MVNINMRTGRPDRFKGGKERRNRIYTHLSRAKESAILY